MRLPQNWSAALFSNMQKSGFLRTRLIWSYAQGKQSWSAHLFLQINSNSRFSHEVALKCICFSELSLHYERMLISFIDKTMIRNNSRRDKMLLLCLAMDYRDFSVKSKVVISLFQTVAIWLSIFHCLWIRFITYKISLISFYSISISFK